MNKQRVNIKQNEDNPVPKDILAEAIVKMSKAVQDLKRSGLNEKAIIVLVQDITKLPKSDIRAVLNAQYQLAKDYVAIK